jgi:2-dehydro-3-deoxyphosphogluconate aldolase/(4S)-4-hydroxy-2-oxoglutarate aldolase
MHEVLERLGELGLVPVVSIPTAEDAPRLGEALLQGGLPCAEITFRTAAAEEAIGSIQEAFPDLLLGAGTVLTPEQAARAVSAGAKFIVSPGFSPRVVDFCRMRRVPIFPGVATPTDVSAALEVGLRTLKFFPSEALGGLKTLKALAAPFTGVKFIPTGGINRGNLEAYLSDPRVLAVGGSWLVKSSLIAEGKFDDISCLAAEAVEVRDRVRAR